jgi:hypothetical protein
VASPPTVLRVGEATYLTVTRAAYDTVAVNYARLLEGELAAKPLDRAMLATFAELVLADGGGRSPISAAAQDG